MQNKGFSLIELLIALAISLISILMLLMLFKQVTHIGMSSSQDSEYNTARQTALLVVQKLIQNAGYGTGSDLDVLRFQEGNNSEGEGEGEESSNNNNQVSLLWRMASENWSPTDISTPALEDENQDEDESEEQAIQVQCLGVSETITQDSNGRYLHQLILIQRNDCPSTGDFAGTPSDWSKQQVIASLTTDDGLKIFDYFVGGRCHPFGIRDLEGTKVTLVAKKSNNTSEEDSSTTIENTQCLVNILSI